MKYKLAFQSQKQGIQNYNCSFHNDIHKLAFGQLLGIFPLQGCFMVFIGIKFDEFDFFTNSSNLISMNA